MPNNGEESNKEEVKKEEVNVEKKIETPKVEKEVKVEAVNEVKTETSTTKKVEPVVKSANTKKKGKGKKVLIFVIILLLLLVGAGVIFVFNPFDWDLPFTIELDFLNGDTKEEKAKKEQRKGLSNKELFINDATETVTSLVNNSQSIGFRQLEKIFNVESAHSKSETVIGTEAIGDIMTIVQETNNDNESGDSAFTVSTKASELTPAMEGGVYFTDGEMLVKSINTATPMVKYELDSKQEKALKEFPIVNKFALVMQDKTKESEIDLNSIVSTAVNATFDEIKEEDFKEETEKIKILDEEQECETLTVTLKGEDAINVIDKLMTVLSENESAELLNTEYNTDDLTEILDDLDDDEKENIKLTISTISHDELPVGIKMSLEVEGESTDCLFISYAKDEERHNEITCSVPEAGEIKILEMNVETGKNEYEGTIRISLLDEILFELTSNSTITEKKEDTQIEFSLDIQNNIEIDGTMDYKSETKKSETTGTNNIEIVMTGSGETQKAYAKTTFESSDEAEEIKAPTFIEESGIVVEDYEDLTDEIGIGMEEIFAIQNSLVRAGGLIFAICK